MAAATDLFGSEKASPTLKFGRLGDLHVILHPPANPSTEDWLALIDYQRRELPSVRRTLVYSMGGGPDAGQRRLGTTIYRHNPQAALSAVVTASPAVRAIVTAFNLFVERPFKPFDLDDIDEAFTHLKLSSSERTAVEDVLRSHAEWLGMKAAV